MKIRRMGILDKKSTGFTIVELLIVIVVIAILAAITVVSYNGITKRAAYTAVSAEVKQYVRTIMLYKLDNDTYPLSGGSSMVGTCVGIGYPNYDGDPSGDCKNTNDYSDFGYNEETAFRTASVISITQILGLMAYGNHGAHSFITYLGPTRTANTQSSDTKARAQNYLETHLTTCFLQRIQTDTPIQMVMRRPV